MVNNNEIFEIKQDWAPYFCLVEDNDASIRLNLGLNEVAPIEGYRYRTWFSVQFLNPDENGFTTREEFPKICQIEDEIVEVLEKNGAILAGTLKTNGTFDMYLYSKNTENYQELINMIMRNHSEYKYATDFNEDIQWSGYFEFLYPSEYEYQTILNRKVIMNLQKSGDNSEKEREVDHWIYFNDNSDRELFITKVKALDYNILSSEKLQDGDYPFQLNISKKDNTIFHNVNDYVWQLVSLAKENNGIYDGWGCPIEK